MTTTDPTVGKYAQFYNHYYRDALADMAQKYPRDKRSITLSYSTLYKFDTDLADKYLEEPDIQQGHFEEALPQVDLPVDLSFDYAHVRLHLDAEEHTYYPSGFSPSQHYGDYLAVRGEVSKATDVYSRMQIAAFECQQCNTVTKIPQEDGNFQEPYTCETCEKQGPFQIDYERSEFIDGQKLRIKTPPEKTQSGDGQSIDGFVEDDLCDVATVGDRVTVSGQIQLEQQQRNRNKTNKFEPYMDIHHVEIEQTDAEDVDITAQQKEEIKALADGEQGDPLEVAADSLAPKIYGYETAKKAIILALVGGSRTEYSGEDFDRGEFHVLLIGDPSTAKSKLVQRAETVGWRAVGISGKGSTVAGVTASAVQDDFADGSWTLDSGAFVKANKGVVAIDELDDMPADVRAACLEPMSKQRINVTKGGINTTLETRTAVIAASNPEHGRFDPYEPIADQFVFSDTLLSRFDLVYTFLDDHEKEEDETIAKHILDSRDAAKRSEQSKDTDTDSHIAEIEPELLRAWIALAKRQPKPVFESAAIKDDIADSFTTLRGMNGRDNDAPIPVTFRKLEGMVRIAEAAAKFEFSDTITKRHINIAQELVGQSMKEIGTDVDGNYDADVVETGTSKAQKDRIKSIVDMTIQLMEEYDDGHAPLEQIKERLDIDDSKIQHEIDKLKKQGDMYQPETGSIRYVGN